MHILQFKLQVSPHVGFLLYFDHCVKPLKLNNDNNYVKKKVASESLDVRLSIYIKNH